MRTYNDNAVNIIANTTHLTMLIKRNSYFWQRHIRKALKMTTESTTATTTDTPEVIQSEAIDYLRAVLTRDTKTLRTKYGVPDTESAAISLAEQTQVACKLLAAHNAIVTSKSKRQPATGAEPVATSPVIPVKRPQFHTTIKSAHSAITQNNAA
ncbi:hypothetical protein ABUL17_07580 [Enterobacter hormaechei]|uniref:hypothetical protein n=1 Tax=Enterobacter cloacae complex TaxID=354276 RepID=UPI000F843C74|nr:hypothetical protein [Enterobacter hormaechei]RTN72288.1 hypothetical protein EKN88_04660 [Enterobacter hormaechei]